MADCTYNRDPLKLVREGTSQDERFPRALDPTYAPVDGHGPAHDIVFAQRYAEFLTYFDTQSGIATGDWQPFFSQDVAAQLAIAATENVELYRQQLKQYFAFLHDRKNQSNITGLHDHLDYLFSACATLAIRLDQLVQALPGELSLKQLLQNRIESQLAPALQRLISYHKGGKEFTDAAPPLNDAVNEKHADLLIFGTTALRFSALITANLTQAWRGQQDWGTYYTDIPSIPAVYGTDASIFARVNHLATHNLFTSIFDQFLKVYARTVSEANLALHATFETWDQHAPHYALFLTFLRLLETARAEANRMTQRHLDFYYRDILRLQEKPAEAGHAHLVVELAKQVATHELPAGELFKAGKDDRGLDAFFANDRDFVANQAQVTALKTVYRHGAATVGTGPTANQQQGRIYAAPVSNSADGLGAPLTAVDQSWHPFFNKRYQDGALIAIDMPKAEMGFALASHYLLLAEGERTVTVAFTLAPGSSALLAPDFEGDLQCLFTAEKDWLEKPTKISKTAQGNLQLEVILTGGDPAVIPYASKIHSGYAFATDLPMLLIKLPQQDESPYLYSQLQAVVIEKITLTVDVIGLKTLAVSNDFGPVDLSKPFLPFGAAPVQGSALIIGSKEVFQKNLSSVDLSIKWQVLGKAYSTAAKENASLPSATVTWLNGGSWVGDEKNKAIFANGVPIEWANADTTTVDKPDPSENVFYATTARNGFGCITLDNSFGQTIYQRDLTKYLIDQAKQSPTVADPGPGPTIPIAASLSVQYTATQTIDLSTNAAPFAQRNARFFHLAPFGQAEQHPALKQDAQAAEQKIYLLPQLYTAFIEGQTASDGEFYIGIAGLQPPQSLALLFQVVDGSADPDVAKPDSHIHWSYLQHNEWAAFAENAVDDRTGGLVNSGIITFALPRDATATNTLLPTGMHWLRAAVAERSAAVCRLIVIAAQALKATFIDKGNDLTFPAKVLPAGTINKLKQPVAAVKKVSQPFATFGGRGAEQPTAFYTRVSERLRHKDRAITLWDYERLILEAFPQIYKVKCLNHTRYEPDASGVGIYQELAPGHVTIVTIPNQEHQNLRDPLRPLTSVGVLQEIAAFLGKHTSCFTKLHVKNPHFDEVWVECKVRLYDGFDETFYENQLRDAITRFLSPWAFPGGGSPSLGGKIYKSTLVKFVEEQPYVDYVTDFKLFQNTVNTPGASDADEVTASTAVSILVSVPAAKHQITIINPSAQTTSSEHCLCEP